MLSARIAIHRASRRWIRGPRTRLTAATQARVFSTRRSIARLLAFGITALGALLAIYVCWWKVTDGVAIDAHAYWAVNMADPYSSAMRSPLDAYLYSPAFAQLITPLRALPWEWFIRIWTALEGAALVLLAGPFTLLVLFAEPTLYELDLANINLLIALALVAGFRWPAAWAFILLTKVTPGVGLIWFAVRRQWRSLAVAIIVTGAIAAVSIALSPELWVQWLTVIPQSPAGPGLTIPIPLWARMVFAAGLVAWGARGNRRWVVPIAVLIAMPQLRYAMFTVLLAVIPLLAASWRGRTRTAEFDPSIDSPDESHPRLVLAET
jgi:hypothetical protein